MIPEYIKKFCNEKEAVIVCEYVMHKSCPATCLYAKRIAGIGDVGFGAMDLESAKGLSELISNELNIENQNPGIE